MLMSLSRLLPLSELPQYVADRYGLSLETAEEVLLRGFRDHSLSAVSCHRESTLGIDLTTTVDFEDAETYWSDNKVRGPGGFVVYQNVHVSEELLNDWFELQLRSGQLFAQTDPAGPPVPPRTTITEYRLTKGEAQTRPGSILGHTKKRRGMYLPKLKSWLIPQITKETKVTQDADFRKEFYLYCEKQRPDLLTHLPKRSDRIDPVIEKIIMSTRASILQKTN